MKLLRILVALVSLVGMTAVFVCPTVGVVKYLGWLPRLQLVPAIMAGEVVVLACLAVSVALFGRLYCSVVCPLGIAQDVVRLCFGWLLPKRIVQPLSRFALAVRWGVLGLFVVGAFFGLTGLIAPYGIFGRFLAVGIRRVGEPSVLVTVWAIALFAFVLAMTFVRARWWCNCICPVGTFLGFFTRWSFFRVRVDASKCVKCALCAKRCDKGALTVRADKTIAVDPSVCVVCGDCIGSCRKGALSWR